MDRQFVNSSDITSIGYDKPSKILEVEFHGSRIYQYENVPEGMYKDLMWVYDTDGFFNKEIKGVYGYKRKK
ncbi:MAG: KTSC domain-containing protein [Hyphomicrobiales bacterium]|nr:KTSC domain-containing protein [Hyphomicrobiales bacterium]